jgi:hypothetical protein
MHTAFRVHFAGLFTFMMCLLIAFCSSCRRDETGASAQSGSTVNPATDPLVEYQNTIAGLEQSLKTVQHKLEEQEQQRLNLETLHKQALAKLDADVAEQTKLTEDIGKALYMYQSADLITPPRAKNADVFPIRVYNINYIFAEAGQEGSGKIRFGIRNLSKTDKCVFISTGKERKRITLASGADQMVEMWSKMGHPIKVNVNHLSRSFDIASETADPTESAGTIVNKKPLSVSDPANTTIATTTGSANTSRQ